MCRGFCDGKGSGQCLVQEMESIENEMEKNVVSRNTMIYRWKSKWRAHSEDIGRDGFRLVA